MRMMIVAECVGCLEGIRKRLNAPQPEKPPVDGELFPPSDSPICRVV